MDGQSTSTRVINVGVVAKGEFFKRARANGFVNLARPSFFLCPRLFLGGALVMALPRTMLRMEHARRSQGLTQTDLGNDPKVRIGQYFISMIERGTGLPNRDQIERLARRLGLHPDDLLKPVDATDIPADEPEQTHDVTSA
jgi:hypothetical protein